MYGTNGRQENGRALLRNALVFEAPASFADLGILPKSSKRLGRMPRRTGWPRTPVSGRTTVSRKTNGRTESRIPRTAPPSTRTAISSSPSGAPGRPSNSPSRTVFKASSSVGCRDRQGTLLMARRARCEPWRPHQMERPWPRGARDWTVRLWDVPTQKERATLKGHRGGVCLAFSADGKTLATGSGDETTMGSANSRSARI